MRHVIVAASVVGSAHTRTGRAVEDHYDVSISPDGAWTCAVVCDGCGSAAHAADGAEFISTWLSGKLLAMAGDIDRRGPGEWTIDRVVVALAALREAMRERFGPKLADYAATIVAAMVSSNGGFMVHLGDGVGIALGLDEAGRCDIVAQSDPENGEFANETFYITSSEWIRHVRLTPFGRTDAVLLLTDGAQPLMFAGNAPKLEVVSALILALKGGLTASGEARATSRLRALLASPLVDRLSNDDKTAVAIILRPHRS